MYRMCAYTHACRFNFHVSYTNIHLHRLPFSMCVFPKKWSEIDLNWLTEWIARGSEHKLRICEHMCMLLYVRQQQQQKKKTKFKTMLHAQRWWINFHRHVELPFEWHGSARNSATFFSVSCCLVRASSCYNMKYSSSNKQSWMFLPLPFFLRLSFVFIRIE